MTFDRLRQLPREEVTFGRLVHAGWRRLAAIPDDIAYRFQAGPGSEHHQGLTSFHDTHQGERCYIVGNGPSLAKTDLSRIQGEYSFGLNRIYLIFQEQEFRPSYYVCMNGLVLEQSAEQIQKLGMPQFLNWNQRRLFRSGSQIHFLREMFNPGFSKDLTKGVWGGATVTFVALQIAFYMGFSEVVLLGVDHHYQATGTPHSTIVGRGGDEDHFVQDYFPEGFRWQLPDLRTSEIAYRMARAAFEADGRRVVDATIGGALEVFPKVDFEDVVGHRLNGVRPSGAKADPKDQSDSRLQVEVEPEPLRSAGVRPSQPLVTIGLVAWNSEKYLESCLAAIHNQSYANMELKAVDNASGDRSADAIRARAPEADLILNKRNEGYCVAHNQILRRARGDYYLPLNPDVVMQPEFVERMVSVMESRPECGSVNGKFWLPSEGPDRYLDSTGLFIDRSRHQYLRGHGQLDEGQFEVAGDIFGADGAAPLYRRQTLVEATVEGQVYDESYFGYHEDVDLAWRIRLLGWTSRYEPSATAVHDRSFKPGVRRPMPPKLRRLAVRNRYLTILKNEAPDDFRRDWWRILSYDARILGYILILEQTSLPAYPMLISTLGHARRWRRMVWSRVDVSAEMRNSWFL
jgi:GT2 family glycosyltransferase